MLLVSTKATKACGTEIVVHAAHLYDVSVVDPGIPWRHLDVVVGGHRGQLHHFVAGRLEAAVLEPHLSSRRRRHSWWWWWNGIGRLPQQQGRNSNFGMLPQEACQNWEHSCEFLVP